MILSLFQESYTTPKIEKEWNKERPGFIIYNHGENNARGTMIAFKPKLFPIIHNTIHDNEGHFIILDCTIFNQRFTLGNAYSTVTDEYKSLFQSLFGEIHDLPNQSKTIAGDFNIILDYNRAASKIIFENTEN